MASVLPAGKQPVPYVYALCLVSCLFLAGQLALVGLGVHMDLMAPVLQMALVDFLFLLDMLVMLE